MFFVSVYKRNIFCYSSFFRFLVLPQRFGLFFFFFIFLFLRLFTRILIAVCVWFYLSRALLWPKYSECTAHVTNPIKSLDWLSTKACSQTNNGSFRKKTVTYISVETVMDATVLGLFHDLKLVWLNDDSAVLFVLLPLFIQFFFASMLTLISYLLMLILWSNTLNHAVFFFLALSVLSYALFSFHLNFDISDFISGNFSILSPFPYVLYRTTTHYYPQWNARQPVENLYISNDNIIAFGMETFRHWNDRFFDWVWIVSSC